MSSCQPWLHLLFIHLIIAVHTQSSDPFIVIDISLNASSAQSHCQNEYSTNLASIHNDDQMNTAISLCESIDHNGGAENCYIGLRRNSNTLYWLDGSEVDYDLAAGTNSECFVIDTEYLTEWIDFDCNNEKPFLCNNPSYITSTTPGLIILSFSFTNITL